MAKFLSDRDGDALKRLADRVRNGSYNPAPPPQMPSIAGFNTDIYIAKTPSGGIPKLSGTTPGSALCDIYQIVVDDNGANPVLTVVPDETGNYKQKVYNCAGAVGGNKTILIGKDMFGMWLPVMGAMSIVVGKVSIDIPPLNGNTPGFGTVTQWFPPGSGGAGAWVTGGVNDTFTGWNFSASAMKAGKFLFFAEGNGYLLGIFESCS